MKVKIDDNNTKTNEQLDTPSKYHFNYNTRRKLAKAIKYKMKQGVRFVTINNGDKVKLNYAKIVNRKDYCKEGVIEDKYKEFVESNKDIVFTAVAEDSIKTGNDIELKLFSLKEADVKWLFHPIDLIKVESNA